MESFYTKDDGEIFYYKLRDKSGPDTIYVSKLTEFVNSFTKEKTSKRSITKVYGEQESCEIVKVKGEFILRCSRTGRDQVKVVVHENDSNKLGFVIQKFRGDTGTPYKDSSFSFYANEFNELLEFLTLVKFIDLSNLNNFKLSLSGLKQKVLVNQEEHLLIQAFKKFQGKDRLRLLEQIRDEKLTKQDLDILSGRKDGLNTFHQKLYVEKNWNEPQWQTFFEKNTWIFGYGLDYRFLSILQREASISNSDLDGKNTVQSDYLLGNTSFTVLVEMKRPDTLLFETTKNRSRSWKLSKYLIESVSQILAQKASWEIKATQDCYTSEGDLIHQKTCDPKCILIIGSRGQFNDNQRDQDIKFRTFEIFRRDSRNIEIITYDELYERAYYIVNQKLPPIT
jgi:Shedu protein SduA, C-terminal